MSVQVFKLNKLMEPFPVYALHISGDDDSYNVATCVNFWELSDIASSCLDFLSDKLPLEDRFFDVWLFRTDDGYWCWDCPSCCARNGNARHILNVPAFRRTDGAPVAMCASCGVPVRLNVVMMFNSEKIVLD